MNIKAKPVNKNAKSSREQKVHWLKKHPELWNMNVYRLRDHMVKEGLCSASTSPSDMRLEELIDTLKLEYQKSVTS
jgi:hypothetical protein